MFFSSLKPLIAQILPKLGGGGGDGFLWIWVFFSPQTKQIWPLLFSVYL